MSCVTFPRSSVDPLEASIFISYENSRKAYPVRGEAARTMQDGLGREEYLGGGSSSPSDSSSPPTPSDTPTPTAAGQGGQQPAAHTAASQALPVQLTPGLVLASSVPGSIAITTTNTVATTQPPPPSATKPATVLAGGGVVVGGGGGSVVYAAGGGVVYAAPQTHVTEGATPVLLNLPHGLQVTHDQNGPGTGPLVTLPMALTSAALQQSAAAVVVSAASVAAASASISNSNSKGCSSSSSSQATPTDLSMHVKREKRP